MATRLRVSVMAMIMYMAPSSLIFGEPCSYHCATTLRGVNAFLTPRTQVEGFRTLRTTRDSGQAIRRLD